MRSDDIAVMFGYMYWVNHRLIDAARMLPPGGFVASSSVTTRDLRATLVHELDVEWSWRLNLQGREDEAKAEIEPSRFRDVESLAEHWHRDEEEMKAWLDSLSDDDLTRTTASAFTGDRRPLWQFLMHVVTHAGQQQADAATLLTLAGQSPGDLSFTNYLAAVDNAT